MKKFVIIFNQFHDIATGASIQRVHDTATAELTKVCEECQKLMGELVGPVEHRGKKQTVFNTLSHDREVCGVTIPAQGSAEIDHSASGVQARYLKDAGVYELSNRHMVCRIDKKGHLVSVKRPGKDQEYLAGKGNRFLLFKDVNTCYDAWELGSMYEHLPVELDDDVRITLHTGLYRAELRLEGRVHDSAFTQEIYLTGDSKSLGFTTFVDWQEKHKMLKVAFPVNAYANEAFHETQFGYAKFPVHRSYQTDADRYEVCNHRYTALTDGAHGAAVLNNGKYGVNVMENEIRLTLLKSAMMPDQTADRGAQHFTYAFYPFDGAFQDSDVVHQAQELNDSMIVIGKGEPNAPIFLGNTPNIIVETVKPADTMENALLVRAYEAMGKQTDCAFTVHPQVKSVVETDMLEENGQPVDVGRIHFGAFEIKTFILHL